MCVARPDRLKSSASRFGHLGPAAVRQALLIRGIPSAHTFVVCAHRPDGAVEQRAKLVVGQKAVCRYGGADVRENLIWIVRRIAATFLLGEGRGRDDGHGRVDGAVYDARERERRGLRWEQRIADQERVRGIVRLEVEVYREMIGARSALLAQKHERTCAPPATMQGQCG